MDNVSLCKNSNKVLWQPREMIRAFEIVDGFKKNYIPWVQQRRYNSF